jgi:TonB-linked SusC/RagA family outer membrane protein
MKKQKIKVWKLLLFFSALLLTTMQINGQIKGKILDSGGMPLPGVNIIEKGTRNGVMSDINGNYQIKLKNEKGAVLSFSFIGMDAKELPVDGKTTLNVTLNDDSKKLDEVVVVAYGTQKKVSVTGAISSVNTKELKQSPSANFVGALAGRLPGLITVQNSGQPGTENIAFYLRGASTTNGQSPLILIDGVPRDNITTIDPNEVATVSILKDASATAVFGVRGANGVILITTKRGASETPQLSVSAEYGLQDFTRTVQNVDSWDYARLKNQALRNDGLLPQFSQDQIEKYRSGYDTYMYPNTRWVKELVKPNTPMSRYNVNVTGGTDRVKYFMNASYMHQGGMFNTESEAKLGYDPQYKMDRYNFRTNLDIKVNSWIKTTVNLAGYLENVNAAGSVGTSRGNPLYIVVGLYQAIPTQPGPLTREGYGVPAGEVISSTQNSNPSYGDLNRMGYVNTDRANLNSTLAFDFDLGWMIKGLSSKVMGSFDSKSTAVIDGNKSFLIYNYAITQTTDATSGLITDKLTLTPRGTPTFFPITLSKSASFQYAVNLQWAINYARTFGKHQVTGMILTQRDNSEVASGTSDLLLPYNVLGVASRATYGYDNRYLLEVNGGYNGSEQFAPGTTRFGFFPAASIGWVLSNEAFMKNQNVITNLKVRASYGKVGNDKLGSDRFLYLDNVSVVTGGLSSSLGSGKYVNEDLFGNPLISWETAYKQNYGVELSIMKDLAFTGDVFFEKRDNILITRGTIPAIQGIPLGVLPKQNLGQVNNKGFELELTYTKIVNKDFSFIVRGNYNYNENKVINFDEAPNDPSFPYAYSRTGYSLSQNWGYEIDWNSPGKGYYTSAEEITNSGLTYEGIQPQAGDFVYKDINDDKVINTKDYTPIKYGNIPRITYGANFSLTYKGFDISAMLQGTAQFSNYYSSWGVFETPGGEGNYYDYHVNAWTKELYDAGEKITYPRLSTAGSSSLAQNSFFIMDKSYLRLKNAEIGYNLPRNVVKKFGAQKVRLYVNGQNIFAWDNLPTKNFDPEQAAATSVPILRVFNFGANIVF